MTAELKVYLQSIFRYLEPFNHRDLRVCLIVIAYT